MCNVEDTRKRFKPDNIKVMFVGESAPQSGKFFFFGNSQMTGYMKQAFEEQFGEMTNFLDQF